VKAFDRFAFEHRLCYYQIRIGTVDESTRKGEIWMNKRLLWIGLALVLSFTMISCDIGQKSATSDFLEVMENSGYEFDQRDNDSREYYQTNQINEKFELDVDVIDLYVGYVNENERWAEVIVFESEAEATEVKTALDLEATEGRFVMQSKAILMITFSSETIQLFQNKVN
jgi:hypothetical protein